LKQPQGLNFHKAINKTMKNKLRPEIKERLLKLPEMDKAKIAESLGIKIKSFEANINRNSRLLESMPYLTEIMSVLCLKSIEEAISTEPLTLPYEHE
jgi:hypothetical protein